MKLKNLYINSILFLILLYLFNIQLINLNRKEYFLLISVISCDRIYYFNSCITSFNKHLQKYDRRVKIRWIYYDQGTKERYILCNKYFHNCFFLNPSGYPYSFRILFTYLYGKYIMLLEEDWVVRKNIEKQIYNPNFLEESIDILNNDDKIYGMMLRQDRNCRITMNHTLYLNNRRIKIYERIDPWCYTNGASIYKIRVMNKLNIYIDEWDYIHLCKKLGLRLGFTYKGINSNSSLSISQGIFKHYGKKSSRKKGMCNTSLY